MRAMLMMMLMLLLLKELQAFVETHVSSGLRSLPLLLDFVVAYVHKNHLPSAPDPVKAHPALTDSQCHHLISIMPLPVG